MRFMNVGFALATVAGLTLTPAYAGHHGGHAGPPAAAHPQVHSTPPHPDGHSAPQPHPAGKPNNGHANKPPAPNTGIAQHISSHPQLESRLQPLLPSNMTIADAAKGFKNEGQFIAALHVSHNLNIPFAQLKAEMTEKHPDSLGQAIQDLRPGVNAKTEARRAESEAKEDLKTPKVAKTKHKDNDDKDTDKDRDDR